MKRRTLFFVLIAVVAVLIVGGSTFFTVQQGQQALVLQFGEPRRVLQEPGLKIKVPFVQNAVFFERRLLQYDAEVEEVIALDQKRLVVDSFVIYRIVDPLRFYQTVGTELGVQLRLRSILSGALRRVLGNVTLATVLSAEREKIMEDIRERVAQEGRGFGIDVVDFRVRRADLPEENNQAIYARMQSEREREAKEFRAQGAELGQRIRSRADRERTVILAEAQRQAQIIRGEGDGEAVRIYAEAFGQDKDFFAFYRTMQAYKEAIDENTSLVISPEGEFFRFLNNPQGRK